MPFPRGGLAFSAQIGRRPAGERDFSRQMAVPPRGNEIFRFAASSPAGRMLPRVHAGPDDGNTASPLSGASQLIRLSQENALGAVCRSYLSISVQAAGTSPGLAPRRGLVWRRIMDRGFPLAGQVPAA